MIPPELVFLVNAVAITPPNSSRKDHTLLAKPNPKLLNNSIHAKKFPSILASINKNLDSRDRKNTRTAKHLLWDITIQARSQNQNSFGTS